MARSIKDLKLWENSTLSRKWNALVDEIERRTIYVRSPLYLTETGSGTVIELIKQRGGGSGGSSSSPESCPFDIILTPQAGPSTHFDLTIQAGSLNSEIPADLLTVVDYDPTTTVFVKIHCLTDGKSVTSSTMVVDSTPPTINEATDSQGSSEVEVCVAVVLAGTVYKTLSWCGSIRVRLQEVFLEDKASPAVGESPYIRWYQWIVEAES